MGFVAQHQGYRSVGRHLGRRYPTARNRRPAPVPGTTQEPQRRQGIVHQGERQAEGGPGSVPDQLRVVGVHTAGDHHARGPKGLGGPEQGAGVARIGDLGQDQQRSRRGGQVGRFGVVEGHLSQGRLW